MKDGETAKADAGARIASLELNLTKRSSETEALTAKLAADEALLKSAGDSGARAKALAAELETTNRDLDTAHGLLAQALRNAQAAKARFEAQDAAKAAELASARQTLETASSAAETGAKAQALAVELEKARNDLGSVRAQLAEALRSAEASKAEAASTAGEKGSLEKQMADLADRLSAATRSYALLQDENTRLKRSLPVRPSAAVASLQAPTQVPATPAAPAQRTHTVVEGDTLTKISLKYYGTAGRWQTIYQANRDVLPNEGILAIGTELRIP